MLRRAYMKYLGFLVLGGTVGSLGMLAYTGLPFLSLLQGVTSSIERSDETMAMAMACTTSSEDSENIFFISCGGIY